MHRIAAVARTGSPGPFVMKRASGFQASITSERVSWGKTPMSAPRRKRLITMFFLTPRSITATRFPAPGT